MSKPTASKMRKTITGEQIQALRDDAATARDWAMVHACNGALAGNVEARNLCADAIERAEARACASKR